MSDVVNPKTQGKIRLSGREIMYLKNSSFLPDDLADIINCAQATGESGITISVSREISEQFRTIFTEQLAKSGFDENYEPTSGGKMLEKLIDEFHMR